MTDTPNDSASTPEVRAEDFERAERDTGRVLKITIGAVAALWSLFQMWIASPLPFTLGFGLVDGVPARAIHLAFALFLCFLIYPMFSKRIGAKLPVYDIVLALVGVVCTLYLFVESEGLTRRLGVLLTVDLFGFKFPLEAIVGGAGILLLLEATRRSIGLPLVIVAAIFLLYSIFGQSMPDIISHKGVSIERLVGYQWFAGEAIFGIPIDVSVSFVFLFVLFGALLEKAGAGKYFLDLAFAMVGRYRGGPAKAAILASGMTGLVSGSSIANVVTTGTFTIPVMMKTGFPATKAGAIEVAASTNGQIMPPIMGAAAFIMAELIGISYFDVIVAAFIPAMLSYIALFYISHLEALKLGLRGMSLPDLPRFWSTFKSGLHFLVPIFVLVYLLMVERWTPGSAVFYSIVLMMVIIVIERMIVAMRDGTGTAPQALLEGLAEIYDGLIAGARNMISIAIAVATAGIIVGSVSSTGLNNAMVGVVEVLSGGNIYALLGLTAILCIVLGMGLPTTANYLVVASLLAGVLVELGNAAGLVLPLIAVHLYVFYFGLMADSTPPVCLAAFAAAAISRADPLKTGVQSFMYDIRTSVLPLVFIFNTELLLIGITSVWHGMMVFIVSLIAILCFSCVTQGWMIVKVRWHEAILLLIVTIALFRPDFIMDRFYPSFAPVDLAKFVKGELDIEPGRKFRVHATRETDYGERFKLFVFTAPQAKPNRTYGFTLEREDDGRYSVSDMAPPDLSSGKKPPPALDFGDYVTEVDVEQPGRPPKQLVYPVALLLLGGVIALQFARRRREGEAKPA